MNSPDSSDALVDRAALDERIATFALDDETLEAIRLIVREEIAKTLSGEFTATVHDRLSVTPLHISVTPR